HSLAPPSLFLAPPPPPVSTLSLHDALPISAALWRASSSSTTAWARPTSLRRASRPASTNVRRSVRSSRVTPGSSPVPGGDPARRSEEHTTELQSQSNLVCRLLLEKKKKNDN